MVESENFKPVGQFAIDQNECKGLRMCIMEAHGVNLRASKVGEDEYKTSVTGQPKTREEQILMIQGIGICPFRAGTIDGKSDHPIFKEHAIAYLADPKYVEKAYASYLKARADARRSE